MALIIRNAHVYAPADLGTADVLMAGGRILAVGRDLSVSLPNLEEIDASGKILTPGFFDQHIHVNGGGGEGGFVSRCPELNLSELIAVGTTSIVGVCGTDFISRSIENLLAKVRALAIEGVSAWMYTSNYRFPGTSMSQSVAKDMFLVPECLGVKIALGDHRSSFPRPDEVLHLLSDIRLTGMITGKGGVLHVHMGDIPGIFEMFIKFQEGGFPIQHIRPTHCSRKRDIYESSLKFAKKGGYVDYTAGFSCNGSTANDILEAIDSGVDPTHITMSTDGHGSMPRFNDKGEMVGLTTGGVGGLLDTIRDLIANHSVPVEKALIFNTTNVADALSLKDQGRIEEGACANACLFNDSWELQEVVSKGRVMMRGGKVVVKGTFEE
ncbi:beta-aspartyl-peptidase [Mesosutterella sp. OilRF-GAM-744-9]|uniref:Isoaspartyl dipeptidase n=1 Tax=Mesosutterella porci TaxID=2915351 RepID=A0ABS9MQZ2_9BURK|nr:beta-aspartyl-peptidase [Mesosutterella sp. oilRF-744-WT-GAM-9]MCG5031047.1 beta-aspartyl-peptidase [Mesosutterella sp. oilRF-744-WT-GAM-9]